MLVGTSQREDLLIRAAWYIFTYIGLGCLIYFQIIFVVAGVRGITHAFSIFIEVIGAIEILWYLIWFLPYRSYLQRPGIRPTPLTRTQRRQLFRKALDLIPDGEQFVGGCRTRTWRISAARI